MKTTSTFTYTKDGLTKIFEEWKRRYLAGEDDKTAYFEDDAYAKSCADCLIEIGRELEQGEDK